MSREPSSFSVAFLLSTNVSSGKALGFRMRYLGDQGEAAMDRTGRRPLTVSGKDCLNLQRDVRYTRCQGEVLPY